MTHYLFIVNPLAGNGRAGRIMRRMAPALARLGLRHAVEQTTGPGDATRIARESTADIVVAVGGDGTINEVVNGLAAGRTLGVVPAGSGNDLVKSIAVPKTPEEALRVLAAGHVGPLDLGQIEAFSVAGAKTTRLFANGIGIGFDAAVAIRKTQIPVLSGTAVYLVAVLQTLRKYEAPEFTVRINGNTRRFRSLLVAVGNGRCAGGGFYLTPEADTRDGAMDICMIDHVRVSEILRLMPKVMRGRHAGIPCVSFARTPGMELESDRPFAVHADGEIVGGALERVKVTTLPAHVQVLHDKGMAAEG